MWLIERVSSKINGSCKGVQCQQLASPNLVSGTFKRGYSISRQIQKRAYLSCSKLRGYFDPGGNKGFSLSVLDPDESVGFWAFDEFPAFPDLTMPRLGGISAQGERLEPVHKENLWMT